MTQNSFEETTTGQFSEFLRKRGLQVRNHRLCCEQGGIDFCLVGLEGHEDSFHPSVKVVYKDSPLEIVGTNKTLVVEFGCKEFDTGAFYVAHAGLISFLFNQRYRAENIFGLRVYENLSFQLFSLEEQIEKFRKKAHEEKFAGNGRMKGEIVAYFPNKGYGFLRSGGEEKFFFHITSVRDISLKEFLPNYLEGTLLPVSFVFGGSRGGQFPRAKSILSLGKTPDE